MGLHISIIHSLPIWLQHLLTALHYSLYHCLLYYNTKNIPCKHFLLKQRPITMAGSFDMRIYSISRYFRIMFWIMVVIDCKRTFYTISVLLVYLKYLSILFFKYEFSWNHQTGSGSYYIQVLNIKCRLQLLGSPIHWQRGFDHIPVLRFIEGPWLNDFKQ